jgi:hypothetical protein
MWSATRLSGIHAVPVAFRPGTGVSTPAVREANQVTA